MSRIKSISRKFVSMTDPFWRSPPKATLGFEALWKCTLRPRERPIGIE